MCGAIGRKEHAQFPGTGSIRREALNSRTKFCCQNVRVDEGLVRTPDERMAQVQS